jgi:hypothetical protein
MKLFFGIFECVEDVYREYSIDPIEGIEFIYADYDYEDYSGSSLVIYMLDNKMYEVNGNHCSCNGLEGTWEPEETSVADLFFRHNVGTDALDNLKERFKNIIAFL